MGVMVRIRSRDQKILRELAEATGESVSNLLSRAVEELRRVHFLRGLADDFATLRARQAASRHENGERKAWDRALGDDLDDE